MANLKLFCLVEGESTSRAFPLSVPSTQTVGDLKKLIKTEKTIAFSDVDAGRITLWLVTVPDDTDEVPIRLDSLNEKKKLRPTSDLSEVFSEGAPKNTIHIIVQRPPPVALATIASRFFRPGSEHAKFLKEFVMGSHTLPVTRGGVPGLPRVGKRGQVTVREAPTLLFFDLPGPEHSSTPISGAEEILTKYPWVRHLPLFGVSGCGKTRTTLELLSRTWGLYFNAGEKDLGSNDVRAIIHALSDRPNIYLTDSKEQNTDRVRYLTFGLLYTRLLILDYCLGIPESNTSFTCQRWMLLQAATPAFQDVFESLFQDISLVFHNRGSSNLNIIDLVQDLYDKVQKQLIGRAAFPAHFKFLLVLDEAQVLSRLADGAFLDSDRKTSRPVLAPMLHAFRRVAKMQDEDKVCVIPCGTGLSYYELEWSGGSSSGAKLSADEFQAAKDASIVVDFAGWTNVDSVSSYLGRLGQALDVEARTRLADLFPDDVIKRLFRDFRGRFRPIVSIIEDIIMKNDPTTWRESVDEFMYRLTTADVSTNVVEKELFHGNLCSELSRVLNRVKAEPMTFARFQSVELTLRVATAAFNTQGGFMAYKGELPELVEIAFGRIRRYNGERYTVIDEPFVFRAANNYFRKTDPGYFQHQADLLATCTSEAKRGEYWECIVPTNLEGIFHNKVISRDLFNGAEPPHGMFQRRAEIVGRTTAMQTTCHETMTLTDFLDAHFYHDSEHKGDPVPPFFFPKAHESGPDIAFVVRFRDAAADKTDITCPVFVQLKLRAELGRSDAEKARETVQPTKINNHGIDLGKYCKPHKHYISPIVSYPAEVAKYFKNEPLIMKHGEDDFEIPLTIDNNNIRQLFAKEYVAVLNQVKRLGGEMTANLNRVKRARI
ncbi:hypothetical protein BGZ54_004332 [Gamsiella multidivaricata]|nr:hypothetical protein BGZ54_004332 [Gamsiella multidivaricata]